MRRALKGARVREKCKRGAAGSRECREWHESSHDAPERRSFVRWCRSDWSSSVNRDLREGGIS